MNRLQVFSYCPTRLVPALHYLGRFPFNKNHRFKFSEFSLVEWNASDRFPEFEVTCSATQGMLGETLLCLKMVDFLKIFAAVEQHDCETISCTILYRNDVVIFPAAIAYFMRRELTRVNGYFAVTIPACICRGSSETISG